MRFNKDDLPYLYEDKGHSQLLPNRIERHLSWEYTLAQSARLDVNGDDYPLIVERVRRKQQYLFQGYRLLAVMVYEWQYLEKVDEMYAGMMQGYRTYWEGDIWRQGIEILQPEVGVLLGFSPLLAEIPPFIETVHQAEVLGLLARLEEFYQDDDALAFPKPAPIEAPGDAPPLIKDALRRMRAQCHLITTRGRAALLEELMKATGTALLDGNWVLSETEMARRQKGLA